MTIGRQTRWLVAVAALMFGTKAGAQSELVGRVLTDSGTPIAGASVTLAGIRYTVRTDSLGRFRLSGQPGSTLNLSLKAEGFRDDTAAVVLPRGRSVTKDFTLVSESSPAPGANPSDRAIRGRVVSTEGEPISYVNVQFNGSSRIVTDDSGRFTAPIANRGSLTIIARRIGFSPAELRLPALPDTAIRLTMTAIAATLPGQVITTRSPFVRLELGGYYRRMSEVQNGARVGYFVTPEDLALRKPQNVTDAVEQFPNIRLAPIDDGARDKDGMTHADGTMYRRKFRIEDRSGCPLTVYLDRIRIQPSARAGKEADEEINSIVQVGSVAGIEVYPRAIGAPAEFPPANTNSTSQCGVVLIWTR
jgi:hypothetical protein